MIQRCEYRVWERIEDCEGDECASGPTCATFTQCPEPFRVKIAWLGHIQRFCTHHAIQTVLEDPTWQVVAAE